MVTSLLLASAGLVTREAKVPFALIESWWTVEKAPKWEDFKGKVLIVHFYPSFCCGWDQSAKLVRSMLDKYPGRVKAVTINYGNFSTSRREYEEASHDIKIDWPLGIDSHDKFVSQFYPNDSTRYTFTVFDKSGQRMTQPIENFEDLPKVVEKLVQKS